MRIKSKKYIVCDLCSRDTRKDQQERTYTLTKRWFNLPYTDKGTRTEPGGIIGKECFKQLDVCQVCMEKFIEWSGNTLARGLNYEDGV